MSRAGRAVFALLIAAILAALLAILLMLITAPAPKTHIYSGAHWVRSISGGIA